MYESQIDKHKQIEKNIQLRKTKCNTKNSIVLIFIYLREITTCVCSFSFAKTEL